MRFPSPLPDRLTSFLASRKLEGEGCIAKGYSSEVHAVRDRGGNRFALKIERDKSPRKDMTERESMHLRHANTLGIGPRFIEQDAENRAVLMEFIDGLRLPAFLETISMRPPSRQRLHAVLQDFLRQATLLDAAGLDHGQLNGKGSNLLITSHGKAVIIDFEKASATRKVHNRSSLEALLFRNPNSHLARKIAAFLPQGE